MSGADKSKLDGVAPNATAYAHPANHPASIITQDASNRFVTDTEKATWNAKQASGTYATGTGTASGTNTGDQTITLTGGVTGTGTGSFVATVVTNANLTGEVTSVGNATTVPNATVIGKVLTGYLSGAGVVAATDTILQAVAKLDGNNALRATLASPTFTGIVGGITAAMVGAPSGTGTSSGANTGDQTTITGNAGTATALSVGADRTKLDAITGSNTGDETATTIRTKLGVTTLSGSNTGDQTLSGLGGQPLDADLTAIAALVGATGLLRKTAADTWALDTAAYSTTTGTVTGVTATAPVVSSGGNTPVISMAAATSVVSGFMTSVYAAKLDGIAAGATNYTHPTGDGNLHVPATSTTNSGRVLTAGATAGALSWVAPLALTATAAAALGTAAAGVSSDAARADHVHAMPTAANVGAMATGHAANAITGFGASSAALGASSAGAATTVARADHVHALPTLNALGLPTADVAMNSFKLSGLAEPVGAQDAATKNYVDNVVQGLDPKGSVVAATVAAGTLLTSFANASVIDGVTLVTGNRILVKNQAAPAENGIYTVNASGAPTRTTDADAWTELVGAFVFVESGTVNADIGFICTVNIGGTLGTTGVTFSQFSTVGELTAGTGLSKVGNVFSVVAASAGTLGGIRVGAGLTIDGSGVLASAGGSAAPMLISVNTAAVAGSSYVLMAALILTLPASPPVGSVILFQNTSGAACTVARNGQPIMSLAEDLTLDLSYTSAKLVYVDATQGWIVTDMSATRVTQTGWPTITNKPTTVAGYGITDAVGVTNLAQGTRTATTVPVTSSTGTTATLDIATAILAGVMSSADKIKLDGVASGATNYVHPTGDGNQHVPATGTLNNNNVLVAGATAGSSAWVPFSLATHATGTLSAARGGTGLTAYAVGDLVFASTATALASLADVAVGNVLISGGVGVAPAYGKVGLASHVSGTLPVANGGTGVVTSTGTGAVVLSTSPILVTPALGVPSSGNLANCTFPTLNQNTTGFATNLAGGLVGQIPYQSAANTTVMLAAGTAGQVLVANGAAAPAWVSGYLTENSTFDGGTF